MQAPPLRAPPIRGTIAEVAPGTIAKVPKLRTTAKAPKSRAAVPAAVQPVETGAKPSMAPQLVAAEAAVPAAAEAAVPAGAESGAGTPKWAAGLPFTSTNYGEL